MAFLGHHNEGTKFLNETWCGLLRQCVYFIMLIVENSKDQVYDHA